MSLVIDADRVLADLQRAARAPRRRPTGPAASPGARTGWPRASGCRGKLDELDGSTVDRDEAGNLWAELPGDGDGAS